jgi:hypothetical protein
MATRNRSRLCAVGRPQTSNGDDGRAGYRRGPRNLTKAARVRLRSDGAWVEGTQPDLRADPVYLGPSRPKFSVAATRLCPVGHTAQPFGCAHPSGGPETYRCHAAVMEQQYSCSAGCLGCCITVTARRNSAHSTGFRPLQGFVLHICINRLLRQVGTTSQTAERGFETERSATRTKLGLALG